MNIITHNPPKTQVKIWDFLDEIDNPAQEILSYGAYLSDVQLEALQLYDMGLNVFPQPYGRKSGYPWKRLQYSRLHRNHHLYGLENLFAGQCNLAIMCGKTSNNLFVIDCETETSFNAHVHAMRERNIPVWASKTGRGGHIYLHSIHGEVHNIATGVLVDAEIRGQNSYVLAPPSLHPSGKHYRWIYQDTPRIPAIDVKQIDWLTNYQNKPVQLTYDEEYTYEPGLKLNQHHGLSAKTRDYIENGHLVAIGNRNNRLFAASCDLAGNQYTEDEAKNYLTDKAKQSGLNEQEIRATIRSAYSQPRDASRKDKVAYSDWYYALAFLMHTKLSGRKSHSERVIMLTLIEKARVIFTRDGKDLFPSKYSRNCRTRQTKYEDCANHHEKSQRTRLD
jgi:hypothetical protein